MDTILSRKLRKDTLTSDSRLYRNLEDFLAKDVAFFTKWLTLSKDYQSSNLKKLNHFISEYIF